MELISGGRKRKRRAQCLNYQDTPTSQRYNDVQIPAQNWRRKKRFSASENVTINVLK